MISEDESQSLRLPLKSKRGWLDAATLGLILVTFLAFLAKFHWTIDLLAQFRVQYVLLALLGLVLCLVFRKPKCAFATLICVAVNLAFVLPYFSKPDQPMPADGQRLRVAVFNVLTSNRKDAEVLEFLNQQDPDVLVIMESSQRWVNSLRNLRETMPYFRLEPRSDNFGLCLFSKLPLEDFESVQLGSESVPSFITRLQIGDHEVQLIATHPLPPMSRRYADARNEQLNNAAMQFDQEVSRVMVGDFNLTPWSPYFEEVCEQGSLVSAGKGFGIEPTWYVFPTWLGGLKIDHVLISPDLGVAQFEVGPNLGSDHRPVLVDLVIPN